MTKISIVIPVYNSQECLFELNRQIQDALVELSYQLIFVNDCSTDESWNKIVEICESNKNAVGISLRKNAGQNNALMAGLRLAKGEYVVIMDDDLQHAPKDILALYNECKRGYDVCYAYFITKKQKWWKNIGSYLNGKVSEKLLNKPKDIYLSPFKVMKKEIVTEVLAYTGPYPYLDALILSITNNVVQFSVEHHERYTGKGNFDFFRSVFVFTKHVTGYSVYPLRLALYLGVISALFSFILGGYFLVEYLLNEHRVEGWISIVLLLLFFGGSILISIGIVGEYVGRVFLTINKKPQYTIEKTTRVD